MTKGDFVKLATISSFTVRKSGFLKHVVVESLRREGAVFGDAAPMALFALILDAACSQR